MKMVTKILATSRIHGLSRLYSNLRQFELVHLKRGSNILSPSLDPVEILGSR